LFRVMKLLNQEGQYGYRISLCPLEKFSQKPVIKKGPVLSVNTRGPKWKTPLRCDSIVPP